MGPSHALDEPPDIVMLTASFCTALSVAFVVGLIPSRITYAAAAALTVLAWIGLAIGSAVSLGARVISCVVGCKVVADIRGLSADMDGTLYSVRTPLPPSLDRRTLKHLHLPCQIAQQRPRTCHQGWLWLHPRLGLNRSPHASDHPVPDRRLHVRAIRRLLSVSFLRL